MTLPLSSMADILSDSEAGAVILSLKVAAGCVAAIAVPGVAVGWLLARRNFPGKAILDVLVHLPLVLPPVVTGYLLLVLLGRRGPVGWLLESMLGVQLAFTIWAAMIASAVMGFPLMVRSVRLAMELVDRDLEQASQTLGAGAVRTFVLVTLPLSGPGILAGLVLAFARSLGEFGATITFAGNIEGVTRTLPLGIYTNLQVPGGEGATMRLAVISVVLSLGALLVSELLSRGAHRRLRGAA